MSSRVSVLGAVFGTSTLAESLAACQESGVKNAVLWGDMVAKDLESATPTDVHAYDVRISHLQHAPFFHIGQDLDKDRDELNRLIAAAAALDIRYVYGVTGGILPMDWEEGAAEFTRGVESLRPALREHNVTFLIEPTIYLVANFSFVHSLRDTVDLAEMADVGICIDVQHCWGERGLRETIKRAAPRLGLVQISDLIPDRHERFRAVPGDGGLPLLRIMDWVLEAGYEGNFDLELSPEPGIDPKDTVARALDRTNSLLDQLGV